MAANVFTIQAGEDFAGLLVRGVLEQVGSDPLALADVKVFVPTRRAVRTLQERFARGRGGTALLPQIQPLGDLDEEEISFEADEVAQAIEPVRRRLLLASLVERWDRAKNGGTNTFAYAQAAALARELARFFDEADIQEVDLTKLDGLAAGALAEHWRHVRDFLAFVRDAWPSLAASEGGVNPGQRRNAALAALAKRYREKPPATPVIAAGTTGSIPATAALVQEIAMLPRGALILPGLDRTLDEESWEKLDEGHSQFGMKQLLERIGIDRRDVRDWSPGTGNAARSLLLRESLRPAPTTDAWQAIASGGTADVARGLAGLSLVEAAHPAEEGTAIALILRQVLEKPGQTGALITPDRSLARRVAAELARWGLAVDDSAGRPLANTPPGAFLTLLAEAAREEFAPVPLLALLKHPLAAGGMEPATFRRHARELDRLALRGPRPDPGLTGVARAIEAAGVRARKPEERTALATLAAWFAELSALLASFALATNRSVVDLGEIAALHIRTAEALAASANEAGSARLWSEEAGRAAGAFVASLARAASGLPPIEASSYPALFRMLAEEVPVRPPYGGHPRLAILGPLEARLQQFDVVVLGGLNEGIWPQASVADPWLSRPMRKALGFEPPERRIGLAAHDFATLAANPRVFLTRSLKVDGAPTVASRWIERLKQLTKGLGLSALLEPAEPYAAYAGRLDLPEARPSAESRPSPQPPVRLRPRGLSVTEIETWLRDPYAIYGRHILKLRPLLPLDDEIGPLERGSAIHLIMERFVRDCGGTIPENALERLLATADATFSEMAIPHAALSVWRPRFARAAAWFLGVERNRHAEIGRSCVEVSGKLEFAAPYGAFVLRGRADRIDLLKNGRAAIIDYKTGSPPTNKQVEILLAPQLPLEGAILAEGGFEDIAKIVPADLVYIKLSGGPVPGRYVSVGSDVPTLVKRSADLLARRIALFDNETTPYPARIVPFRSDISGDYDHLARVREWSLSGWRPEDE